MNSPLLTSADAAPRDKKRILPFLRDIAIVAAITLAGAGFVELTVRKLAPQNIRTEYIRGGPLGLKDPVLGHVNRPDTLAHLTGPEFTVEYRINAQGFRDAAVYPAAKTPGRTRILLLGDSFTEGSGVPYSQIWPVLTEQKLREAGHDVEVIKAGVFGYDTRQEVLYLERLHARFQPDIVVIGFVFHDLFSNGVEQSETAFASMASKKSQLHSLNLARRMLMANDALYTRLYGMSGRGSWFAASAAGQVHRQEAVTRDLFLRAAQFCRERGSELVVLSFPQLFHVLEQAQDARHSDTDPGSIDRSFAMFATKAEFSWIPLLPHLAKAYRETGDDLYYRFDGHPNAAGSEVISTIAADTLAGAMAAREPTPDK